MSLVITMEELYLFYRLVVLSGMTTGLLRDAFMSALLEEALRLVSFMRKFHLRSLGGASRGDDPCLMDEDNNPCLRQGSGGSAPTPIISPLRAVSSFFVCIKGRRELPFIIDAVTRCNREAYKAEEDRSYPNPVSAFLFLSPSLSELITSEDLNVIREGYNIPSSIVLSAPAAHKTPRDNHPGHLYLNEYMLGAGVRIPFDFGVAEGLWAFNVPPARVTPHSWKVIQTMAWYCEHRLLVRWDVKGIDNPPDCVPSLPATQLWALMYFRGTALRWHPLRKYFLRWCESTHFAVAEEGERRALKRARPSREESCLANSDSSVEGSSGSLSSGQQAPTVEPEGMVLSSVVTGLREELEAPRAKVARFQLTLRGDAARPSAVMEYLRSKVYRHWMEFEKAHHSQSGYIRALSDVAALYPELDLSSLYLSP
ncbi:hypothetical protein ACLOJK_040592 [Asimina triloba]